MCREGSVNTFLSLADSRLTPGAINNSWSNSDREERNKKLLMVTLKTVFETDCELTILSTIIHALWVLLLPFVRPQSVKLTALCSIHTHHQTYNYSDVIESIMSRSSYLPVWWLHFCGISRAPLSSVSAASPSWGNQWTFRTRRGPSVEQAACTSPSNHAPP